MIAAWAFGASLSVAAAEANPENDKTALAVEALSKLQGVNLETNAKLKETVLKILEKTRGTPSFVKLVQQFNLSGQNRGLLEVALAQPSSDSGVQAMRLLLAGDGTALVSETLAGTNVLAAAKTAEALGHTGGNQTATLLLPIVTEAHRDPMLRRQAVRSLAKTHDGADALLKLAQADRLADDLKFTASTELNQVRWPEIKTVAAKLLPLAQSQDAAPLPPLGELVKRTGNPANGAIIFARANPGCIACHVVKGQGTDFGPNLSEIGSKLGKDALYESILDPSAGISFGYEAFNWTFKNGDEAYGLLASETNDEIAVKVVGGIVTRYKKAEILSRQPSKLSIMPSGLQAAMTPDELVDLVEYLASLKKP